jgi:hypothetical protein
MLTVVFGAGASFDCVPSAPGGPKSSENFRLPLANQLFDDRAAFATAIEDFEVLQPIIPRLRHLGTNTLESALTDLESEAVTNPRRSQQLMAVRYYLRQVIGGRQDSTLTRARGVTNYKTLLDDISHWNHGADAVCLITFNYDTMVENALLHFGRNILSLDDYVTDREEYALFKLHGSIDWAHPLRNNPPIRYSSTALRAVAQTHIREAADLRISPDVSMSPAAGPLGTNEYGVGLVPAVAIPILQKQTFECPESHLEVLQKYLPLTDRLLLIGWRATELHFLAMLRETVRKPCRGMVVAGSAAECEEISARMRREVLQSISTWEHNFHGFTDFVVNRRLLPFLK